MRVASDNPDIGDDKITLGLNAREYLDNQNNNSLTFELYHFPEDAHLLPISKKRQTSVLSHPQKIPKLSFLSLLDEDDDSQNVISNQQEEEILADNTVEIQADEKQEQKKKRGRKRK
ncbi:7696_t:CDS:2 [Rhizophagus irregularis]|nr:7696_t:CDS:2 [Rhizophagus irregularis]